MADLLRFFTSYVNNLTLWPEKNVMLATLLKFVMHVANKQFSDNFDNG